MAEKTMRLLVVDDDDLILQTMRIALPSQWSMAGVNSQSEIPQQIFHAALVDIHLSGKIQRTEGLEIISHLSQQDPHLEIIAMSGNLNHELMEECLKRGASRFLAKPMSPEELKFVLDKIEAYHLLQKATTRSGAELKWVGDSSSANDLRRQIAQLKGEAGPILIEGESGTGKEVVAHLLHNQEARGPVIKVNVAAIPENLFESEIFGHVKGAFTGADQNKMGVAEAAHGGDLFLDEIEALPLNLQAKLLRFLENGEIRRVGSKESIHVKTRVIAATNQKLEDLVKQEKFREDLMWRLSGKKIVLPPLRTKITDIPAIAEYFLSLEKPRRNKTLSPEATESLKQYPWPGNVRELKRVLEQIALISPLPVIRATDVMNVIQPPTQRNLGPLEKVDLTVGLNQLMAQYEKRIVQEAFNTYGDIDKTCRVLDISRSSLYKKIKDYGISLENIPHSGE
ncbi:MAG: sigma-54-dependent transcriptional regulator [Bdellovibrionales bacterium]